MKYVYSFKYVWLGIVALIGLQSCGNKAIVFKKVAGKDLALEVYSPAQVAEASPAAVFFFGGGWQVGDRSHFEHQATYFAKRGMVCFLVDYRTSESHGTTPFEALKDAKSVMRYIRKNALRFHIDPDRIVASGGSAGGHLAAATALCPGYNEAGEDTTISAAPNALLLFNAVVDNGPDGCGYSRIGEAFKTFSPLHNVRKGAPPTLIMQGTEDELIPEATAIAFHKKMEAVNARCDLKLYPGEKHSFFNYRFFEMYRTTLLDCDQFLQSIGYLDELPKVMIE